MSRHIGAHWSDAFSNGPNPFSIPLRPSRARSAWNANRTEECKNRISLADVLDRLPGTLGAEAAWALALKHRIYDEDATVIVPVATPFSIRFLSNSGQTALLRGWRSRSATQ